MRHNAFPLSVITHKRMSDNEIEDVQFLPGPSAGKRSVYEPKGLEKCKQIICSPTRAALIVTAGLALIFLIALIASLARPPPSCTSQQQDASKGDGPTTTAPPSSTNKSFPWKDIRLPTSILPLSYTLFMHPNLTTFTFNGSVDILLKVVEKTNFFLFHIKNMTVWSHKLFSVDSVTGENEEEISISHIEENAAHEQVYIKTWEDLEVGHQYKLMLHFTGNIGDNLAGFYRSSYQSSDDQKIWIATTHFESSDARAAFPCFDEPEMKATFKLSIVRDEEHISLFNTEQISTTPYDEMPSLFVDTFAESVKMSTYLVAFVVCDYARLTDVTPDGKNVSIYAPSDLIEEASLAMEVSPKILTFYEEFYDIEYPLSKSDHIAVPDFAAGAMENWGLITYRLRSLLVNETTASPGDKQWVVIVIAHELAHQWFGNLVTMKWWNDLWLNEGFASFMEYKGTDHVRPEWKMWDQFLTSTTWRAFSNDGLRSSHPISVEVNDTKDIEEIFDAISYDKGASVIRMCNFFLGPEKFREGLQLYLRRHQFANAETKDLWNALSEKSPESDLGVADIMDTWTGQMGYPVVSIELTGNTLKATQERFLYNPRSDATEEYTSPYDYQWYIPLSYTTSNSGYSSTNQVAWMERGPATLTLEGSPSWVKVNVNCTALYRVHYKGDLWDRLIQQLKHDHLVFSAADRAHLLEDAFALTRSGHLPISKALELSTYLLEEKEYVPWATALNVLGYVSSMMENKADYVYLRKFFLDLMKNQLAQNVWEPADDHLQKFLQSHIIGQALHLHDDVSIKHAMSLFHNWMYNKTKIEPTLKSLVYSAGAKYGGQAEWEFLWKQYEHPDTALEKKSFLHAMTATTDSIRIMRLLDWSLNPEKVRSSDAVSVIQYLAGNPAGQLLTWNFIKQNWNLIFNRYKNMAFQMKHIIDVAQHFNSQYFYDDAKEFFHHNLKGQDERSIKQALESIAMNIDWLNNNKDDLVTWLKEWNNNHTLSN